MIAWIVLKGLPSFASVLELGNTRIAAYAAIACVVLITIFFSSQSAYPSRFHGLGTLTVLFLAVAAAHLSDPALEGSPAETLVTTRNLFLGLSLVALLHGGTDPRKLSILLLAYLMTIQVVSINDATILFASPDFSAQASEGIYGNAFTVGYAAVVTLAVSLMVFETSTSVILKLWAVGGVALSVTSMFLSINRTSIGGLLLVVVGWIVDRMIRGTRGRQRSVASVAMTTLVVVAVALMAVGALGLFAPEVLEGYVTLWRMRLELLSDPSEEFSRWLTVVAGWKMFLAHPLTGVGWDRVGGLAEQFGADMPSTAHNAIIQAAAEGGVLGLGYAIVLLFLMPLGLFMAARGLRGRFVFLGAWAAVLLFNGIASVFMLEAHWDLLFAFIIVISWQQRRRANEELQLSLQPSQRQQNRLSLRDETSV